MTERSNSPQEGLRPETDHQYPMRDLLNGSRYRWQGARNFVRLAAPVQASRLRRRVQLKRDFDKLL